MERQGGQHHNEVTLSTVLHIAPSAVHNLPYAIAKTLPRPGTTHGRSNGSIAGSGLPCRISIMTTVEGADVIKEVFSDLDKADAEEVETDDVVAWIFGLPPFCSACPPPVAINTSSAATTN